MFELGEKLGKGTEHNCYRTDAIDEPTQIQDPVTKLRHWFGKIWQTPGRAFIERCLAVLKREEIEHIPTEIHENTTVVENGIERVEDLVIVTPFIENVDERTIRYYDLIDPEKGPALIAQLANLVVKADNIYHEDKLGLDLYGGAIVVDVISGIFQTALLEAASLVPELHYVIPGIRGEIRNLILEDGKALLIDTDMHDLSREGKFKLVTRNLHHLLISSLIEILKIANEKLPVGKQIDPKQLEDLPFNGSAWHRATSQKLAKMMIPLFERYRHWEGMANPA